MRGLLAFLGEFFCGLMLLLLAIVLTWTGARYAGALSNVTVEDTRLMWYLASLSFVSLVLSVICLSLGKD